MKFDDMSFMSMSSYRIVDIVVEPPTAWLKSFKIGDMVKFQVKISSKHASKNAFYSPIIYVYRNNNTKPSGKLYLRKANEIFTKFYRLREGF